MSTKVKFSVLLIVVGVITALLVIFTYGMSGGNTVITLAFISIAILCIMAGSILGFSRLLDRSVNPLVEELHKDIEDDLQDLKERRFTNTHLMVVLIALALLAFSFFIFRFHKVEAMWGPLPVFIPTILGLAALAWFIPRTGWFKYSRDYTPMWIFFIPTIGLILTLWLGLAKTENMQVLRSASTQAVSYNTYQPVGLFLQGAGEVADLGFDLSIPDCDGDACAVFLVIGLVILVFVLVIGSAFIPHFWFLSGSLMLAIMVLITIHDLRIRPRPTPEPVDGP